MHRRLQSRRVDRFNKVRTARHRGRLRVAGSAPAHASAVKTASLLCGFLLMLLAPVARAADADNHLPMIDELFRAYNQPDAPGASVMVIHHGKVLVAKSYGLADVENKIPAT